MLATNLLNGVGDVGNVGTSSAASPSMASPGHGACRLSFSSVLLIIVTILIIKVKKTLNPTIACRELTTNKRPEIEFFVFSN